MLREFMEWLTTQVAANNRDKIRVLKTPDGMPGQIVVAKLTAEGIYDDDIIQYETTPVRYITKTLRAFLETVKKLSVMQPGHVDVFIGEDAITAYLQPTRDPYMRSESVILKLEHTRAWQFVSTGKCMAASALKFAIKEIFTGYEPAGDNPIISLVDMLSKVSVSESKKSMAANTQSTNSLGLDVQQGLELLGNDMPEVVPCPVQVYSQHDYLHYVKMLFRYDFENSKFVLTPIQRDLDEALDTTVAEITDAIGKDGDYNILPCQAVVPSGVASF